MRLLNRRRVISFLAISAIAVAALLNYRMRNTYRCQICHAKRDVFQWHAGIWGSFSIPIWRPMETISETWFAEDFLPDHKKHAWVFAQGSPYYWGSHSGGCALGRGRHISTLFEMSADDPEFQAFIRKRIQAGTLNRDTIILLMSERAQKDDALRKQSDQLLEDYSNSR